MASEPLFSGGGGGDGDGGPREKKPRWNESKVYTRKSLNKKPKTSSPSSSSQPRNPPPQLIHANDVDSSFQLPPPPAAAASAAPSDDEAASSLNHRQYHQLPNGHNRSTTISLSGRSRRELWQLRRRFAVELEQIRALSRKLDARELQNPSAASLAPTPGYTNSQFSASDPNTPIGSKRPPPPFSNSDAASLRRNLSVSVPAGGENSATDALDKEKRTPKANQYYRNSEFILGKDKLPPSESHSHKKSKLNGGKGEADLIASQSPDRMVYAQAFKSCSSLLSKLMKHRHAWVFKSPVDTKALGLHDYHTIIREPMDLGTVKSRLGKNWYKAPGEFAEDVRLTFCNAMTYNPKGQDVHAMAEQLLQIFDERWPAIESEYMHVSYPPPLKKVPVPSHPPPPPADARALERSDSTVNPASDSKLKTFSTQHMGRAPALKKPKAKDPHKRDMTFEEKQKLSNNLQSLPSEKLDMVVQIIKKRNLSLNQHDDEIEVDIDSVDPETLWELDRFVTNYKKSLSKNKRKAELLILEKTETEHNSQEMVQERPPAPILSEASKENKTVANEEDLASSSPFAGDKKGDDVSGSNSSSNSSSASSSSDSDSDTGSSSANGSGAGHSPRT